MAASSTYFGVSSDALPGDARSFDQFDRGVGKAPSMVEFFDTWDHGYAATGNKVKQTWARGALARWPDSARNFSVAAASGGESKRSAAARTATASVIRSIRMRPI